MHPVHKTATLAVFFILALIGGLLAGSPSIRHTLVAGLTNRIPLLDNHGNLDADTLQHHPASDFVSSKTPINAATLAGHPGLYYLDAGNLTGTIDNARYSAYSNLESEGKIAQGSTIITNQNLTQSLNHNLQPATSSLFGIATGLGLSSTTSSGTTTISLIPGIGVYLNDGKVNALLGDSVDLTSEVINVLPVASGGTGLSTAPAAGKLLVGNGTGYTLTDLVAGTGMSITASSGTITVINTGVTNLTGTANQVFLTGSTGNIQLALPQDIASSSSPTFSNLNLSNHLNFGQGSIAWNPSATQTIQFPDDSGTVCLDSGNCAGLGITGSGNTGYLAKFTNTGAIGNSLLFDDGSGIGINATTPAQALEVNGNLAVDGAIRTAAQFTWSAQGPVFNAGTANQVAYINLGNIDYWGWLEVTITGNYFDTSSTGKLTKRFNLGRNQNGAIITQSTEIPTAFGNTSAEWNIGDVEVNGSDIRIPVYHLTTNNNEFSVSLTGGYDASVISQERVNNFSVSSVTTIANSATRQYPTIMAGRVGLGAQAPLNALDIAGGTAIGSYAGVNTAPSNGMIVSGNVGIGTTNPTAALYVAGNASFVNTGIAATTTLTIQDATLSKSGGNYLQVNTGIDASIFRDSANTAYYLDPANGFTALTVNGNVGIGTASPVYKLDVNGTLHASNTVTLSSLTTNGGLLWANGSGQVGQTTAGSAGNCLLSNAGGSPTWGSCAAANTLTGSGSSGQVAFWSGANTQTGSNNFFWDNANRRLGIGITGAPAAALDLASTNVTSNAVQIAANSLTSGNGLYISSTSTALTTGSLLGLYWNPGSATTATGDLFSIDTGANATVGNLLDVKNNGAIQFAVSQTQITANLPVSFNAPGDTSLANDLVFTNGTSSAIRSEAPLQLISGESFGSSNLTLSTYNSGSIVFDTASVLTNSNTLVGIDITDTPGSALDLNGALSMRGLSVPSISPSGQGRIYFDSTSNTFKVSENGSSYADVLTGGRPLQTPIVTKTGAYTITATDSIVLANTTGGTFAITLPTAVGIAGKQYTIKELSSSNFATVSTTSAQTIDSSATYAFTAQNESITVVSDGSNWEIIGKK